jgi:hypothetical protein
MNDVAVTPIADDPAVSPLSPISPPRLMRRRMVFTL